MSDKFEVTLTIEQELLISVTLLLSLLNGPLLAKHILFLCDEFLFLCSLDLPRILLPVKNSHSVSDLLLLFTSLSHLSFEFLLSIELPELSVDLFLHHFPLNVATLVDELLLTLDSSSIVVELGVLLSQGVI